MIKVKQEPIKLELEKSFIYDITNGQLVKPIIINDLQEKFTEGFVAVLDNEMDLPIQSSLCTPILVDGLLYGLINMDAFRNQVFSNDDMEVMGFLAEQLGYAIKNQRELKAHSLIG